MPNIVMRPFDALRSHSQTILLDEQLVGKISADLVADCPPGVPILMPGEEISPWHCSMLGKKRIRIVRDRP
jgi:arginine/lysine/ornithine decarboxylase